MFSGANLWLISVGKPLGGPRKGNETDNFKAINGEGHLDFGRRQWRGQGVGPGKGGIDVKAEPSPWTDLGHNELSAGGRGSCEGEEPGGARDGRDVGSL